MSRRQQSQPAMISFAAACRGIGISVYAGEKLVELDQFPSPVWLGGKRFVFRHDVEAWLDKKRVAAKSSSAELATAAAA